MSPRKLHLSAFASTLVASFILIEVTGIPLPLRDNPAFGIHRPEQPPTQRSIPYGSPDSRFRRHQEERPIINQHQSKSFSLNGDQSWLPNSPNDHSSREPNQFGALNYQNQYQQKQPQQSGFGNPNNPHRERRDVHYRVQKNDWQIQPDQTKQNVNSQNGFRNSHCISPDCMAKVASNNIRNENNNGPSSNKIPNAHPNPYGRSSGNHNKIQPPSLQLTPPPHYPENDQDPENFREFYDHRYGIPVENQNYPNNVPLPTTESFTEEQGDSKNTRNASTDTSVLTIRASSIAIGDNFEIVRIEVDLSDREDNEETNLEVEDQ